MFSLRYDEALPMLATSASHRRPAQDHQQIHVWKNSRVRLNVYGCGEYILALGPYPVVYAVILCEQA